MRSFWKRRAEKTAEPGEYQVHKLAMKEDPSGLRKLLDENNEMVNEAENGMLHTPLMLAVEMERTESVQLLLEYGADSNLPNIEGRTALHLLPERQPIAWTGIENKLKIAKLLLRHGADLATCDRYGWQPLWYAVFYVKEPEDVQLVEMYLAYGADSNYKNENNGQSALDFAKKVAYRPLVEVLEGK